MKKEQTLYDLAIKQPLTDNEIRVSVWRTRKTKSLRFSISGQIAPDATKPLVDDLCSEVTRKIKQGMSC